MHLSIFSARFSSLSKRRCQIPPDHNHVRLSNPTVHLSWIPSFGIHYLLGIDGISFPLVLLTSFISMLAMGASWPIDKHVKAYCMLFLLLETGMLGVFLALDFFLFYVFWEVMLLPMYFLIGVWGGPRREYAAIKFFLYTLLGSVLMLIAILMLYFASDLRQAVEDVCFDRVDSATRMPPPTSQIQPRTFNILALQEIGQHTDSTVRRQRAGQIAAVVGVPAAVHRLRDQGAGLAVPHLAARRARRGPDADHDDPGRRAAEDGRLRHHPHLLPDLPRAAGYDLAWFVCGVGVVSMVYGAFAAMAQTDFKRLVAYSSVSHMGYVLLGIGVWSAAATAQPEYWKMGMNGAMFQMIAHGISSAGMFFMVGVIYDRVHHRNLEPVRRPVRARCRSTAAWRSASSSPAWGCRACAASSAKCSSCCASGTTARRWP